MLKLLKRFTKKEWILAAAAFLLILVQVWFNLTMPDYMSEITTLVQTEGSAMSAILAAGGKMLACALGSLLSAVLVTVCAARIASNFSANLRGQIFDRVQSFSMAEIGRFSTASLITRSTNDVMQVQLLIVMGLEVLIKAPVTAVWAICKIANQNWQWTMATGVSVVVLLVIVGGCVLLAMPKFKKLQSLTDNINRVTREDLSGQLVVRAYNAEDYQEKKFSAANDELTRTQLFANRTMSVLFPGVQLVMSGLSLAIYWLGAFLIQSAGVTEKLGLFSQMVVFSQYAVQVVMSFMMLVIIFVLLPRASVSARRINEVLDMKASIEDGSITQGKAGLKGEIEFRNVSFRYPDADKNSLEHITFSAEPGKTTAIIGSTGCGKSTLLNLLLRFYDVTEGRVTLDGVDIREISQSRLRETIGYVPQKGVLFSGTIESNLKFGGGGISDEDMKKAAEIAQASEFIAEKPDGFDSSVAQNGTNVSGGQRQRLSIARAIAKHPKIFLFDDSFSALDYKTDVALRRALDENIGGATKIIVAQRISTILHADKIVVLEEGRIAGTGTHQELMDSCETYREIAQSQLSKAELEGGLS